MNFDPIRLKTELLCWGIQESAELDEAYRSQNPYMDKRTGNAGLQLLLPGGLVANVPVYQRFTANSPYRLARRGKALILRLREEELCECDLVRAPRWYQLQTSDGVPMCQVLIQEERNKLIGSIYTTCEFFRDPSGGGCAFCALRPYGKLRVRTPNQFREVVEAAVAENPSYSLQLTGGSTLEPDRGGDAFVKVIKAIRVVSDIQVCIEAVPPETNETLDRWVEAGANAFSVNIEVWDERLRRLYCPTKSKISRERYLQTWDYLSRAVGQGTVDSVLIAGLESLPSALEGARVMIERGVTPTILPFRPNDGSIMQNAPTISPGFVETLSIEVARMLSKAKLDTKGQAGCHGCEG